MVGNEVKGKKNNYVLRGGIEEGGFMFFYVVDFNWKNEVSNFFDN